MAWGPRKRRTAISGAAAAPASGRFTRREFLAGCIMTAGVAGLMAACAPTAPAPPTAAPAKPAEAAEADRGGQARRGRASRRRRPQRQRRLPRPPLPADAGGARFEAAEAKPAAVAAKGSITMVIEAEPDTIQPKDATTDNSLLRAGQRLRRADRPRLVRRASRRSSASWPRATAQQTDPKTWRFKLRPGIKFTNGEPVNADAVVTMVTAIADPDKPGQAIDEYGLGGATATKVDELTVDITTQDARRHLPESAGEDGDPGAEVVQGQPPGRLDHQAVGSGPYKLAEYVKASHFLLKANEEYWGTPKPTIAEIKILFRNEAAVRAGMLQAGEVQLATLLTPEEAKKLPASMIELTGEAVGIRINTEHPLLKDLRVRQAINMSIDRKGMIDALLRRRRRAAERHDGPEELGRLQPEPEGVPVRPGEGQSSSCRRPARPARASS